MRANIRLITAIWYLIIGKRVGLAFVLRTLAFEFDSNNPELQAVRWLLLARDYSRSVTFTAVAAAEVAARTLPVGRESLLGVLTYVMPPLIRWWIFCFANWVSHVLRSSLAGFISHLIGLVQSIRTTLYFKIVALMISLVTILISQKISFLSKKKKV